MGILHSTTRYNFGCKSEEGHERPRFLPVSLNPGQNHSTFLPKTLIFGSSIYNAVKGLLQKFHLVFHLIPWPRKTADPLLPIQNPASSVSSEPLFVQTTLVSSPANESSADSILETAATTFLLNIDDQELQRHNVDVSSCQRWKEEKCSSKGKHKDHDVMVSIVADYSPSAEIIPSAVFAEKIAPRNVPCVKGSVGVILTEGEEKEGERQEEKVKVKSFIHVVGEEEKWIKHYSSRHRILLVGEGDFSFSACLADAFGCASNMIATSLNSKAFLEKNYGRAPSNIEKLRSKGSKVMHGIDATEMANHELLGQLKYDRIIFNFPFAGFFTNLSTDSQIRRHRELVSLFLKNAKAMLSEDGEIHVSHKTNGRFHAEFKLESVASSHELGLIEAVKLNCEDYPGYNTKYGFGGDKNFNCNPSKTYKFGLKRFQY